MTERTCTACGAALAPQAQFCTQCGTAAGPLGEALSSPAPTPADEPSDDTVVIPRDVTSSPPDPGLTAVLHQRAAPREPPPPEPDQTTVLPGAITTPMAPAPSAPQWARPAPAAPPLSWQDQTAAPAPPQPRPTGWPGEGSGSASDPTEHFRAHPPAPASYPAAQQGVQQYGPPQRWSPSPDGSQWASAGQLGTRQPPPKRGGNVVGAVLALLGGVLLVVGAFTPWVRTSLDTFSGWTASPDAKVIVGLAAVAVIAAIVLLAGARALILRLALLAAGVTALVITVINIITVDRVDESLNPAIGVGLVFVPIGAVLLLAGAALTRSARH